jgi:4-carboxymuconolactone decarboxylase
MRADIWNVLLHCALADYEQTLRRLAVGDDRLIASLLTQSDVATEDARREEQVRPLFRLAALIAGGGTCASYQSLVDGALAAGTTVEEIVDVLFAIAKMVGSARVVAAAPLLARAVGFDVDSAFDCDETTGPDEHYASESRS